MEVVEAHHVKRKALQMHAEKAKLKSKRRGTWYKFGVRAPKNYKEAMKSDKDNGDTYWQDAVKLELSQILGYDTFKDIGIGAKSPTGF